MRTGLLLARNRAASACMDLSDGLADGVRQIAEASGVGMVVDAAALPIDGDARAWFEARGGDPLDQAMTGGDDYELMFTVPPPGERPAARCQPGRDVALTRIGICTKAHDLILRRAGEGPPTDEAIPSGYTHFR